MKRKNIIILILILIVLSVIYYISNKQGWNTAKISPELLSVKDTASITKIFMANKNGDKVMLERKEDGWYVNGAAADMQKVNLLLQTLYQIRVLMPVGESAVNTALSILASKGIKTELYANDKLIKTIYVGTETPDQTGTIMLLDGNDKPVIAHIPGFIGYLTPRFIVNEIKLKSRLVFNYLPEQIKLVSVTYPTIEKNSFYIQNQKLFDDKGNWVKSADSNFIKFYLNSFAGLYAEGFYTEFSIDFIDSLFQSIPYCEIKIVDNENKFSELRIYNKPVGKRTKERFDAETNQVYEFDTERYYALLNNSRLLMGIQSYNFGKIMKRLKDFETIKK